MNKTIEKLAKITPSERILLMPHCLRQSGTCKATYNQMGLQCIGCNPGCSINKLRKLATSYGYKGICVAPGGRLAIKFVKEMQPKAIVAVACAKELEEGVTGVRELAAEKIRPLIAIIPLVKDGCVDTQVDEAKAIEIISAGCPVEIA